MHIFNKNYYVKIIDEVTKQNLYYKLCNVLCTLYLPVMALRLNWAFNALIYTLNPMIGPNVAVASKATTRDDRRPRNTNLDMLQKPN